MPRLDWSALWSSGNTRRYRTALLSAVQRLHANTFAAVLKRLMVNVEHLMQCFLILLALKAPYRANTSHLPSRGCHVRCQPEH